MAAPRRRFLFLLMAALAGAVRKGMEPPPEVMSFFRSKALRPGFSWQDVWGEEHALAFTVAGVMEERVLAEFKAGIDKALNEGKGFEAFREEMRERLTPLGWWGKRDTVDPETGEVKEIDFSRPARLETTFWSNVRSARAAGQWDRAQRTKRALPYILYVRSTAREPRAEHLGWSGIILPVDDPFWQTHWPPNGWGCKCAVRQISASARDRYLEAREGSDGIWYTDTSPPLDAKPWRNKTSGEVTMIPAGIDPGWHTNPGIGRAKTLASQLTDRMDRQDPAVAREVIKRFVDSKGFESFVYRAHRAEEAWSALPVDERRMLQTKAKIWNDAPVPVAVLPEAVAAATESASAVVTATDFAVAHNASHALAPWEWGQMQEMLDKGEVRKRSRDGALQVMAPRDQEKKSWWYLILHRLDGLRWSVGTLMRSRASYIAKERAAGELVKNGEEEIVAEERP